MRKLLFALSAGVLAVVAIRRLSAIAISGDSMRPTLSDGDWVIAIRSPRRVAPGQIVVFDHPDRPGFELVKRVAVVGPGTVDGHPVPTGALWVTADDPADGGVDSRRFGPVPAAAVTARVVARYHPGAPALLL